MTRRKVVPRQRAALVNIEELVSMLRGLGHQRQHAGGGESASIEFVKEIYRIYCHARQIEDARRLKKLLGSAAGVEVKCWRKLSDLLLIVARGGSTKGERKQFIKLIESAYTLEVSPHDLKAQIAAMGSIDNAVQQWSLPANILPNPGDQMLPGLAFDIMRSIAISGRRS